jgi:hypothetical protein
MDKVDYGPMRPETTKVFEGMRLHMSPEQRLLAIKFLARTVSVDGDPVQKALASTIDASITDYFRNNILRDN